MSRCSSCSCRSRERRAHRGDDRLEAGLPERDHVGVPLDDDGALLLGDRGAREMEPVEDRRLVEQLALGRVHVLAAQRVVVAQLPRLEADDTAARVREREHQPRREVVVAARVVEPGGAELVGREALLLRLPGEPAPRREPEPELAADLLAETAAREVLPHGLTRRRLPQVALEERRRLLEQRRGAARAAARSGLDCGEVSSYSSVTRKRSASDSMAPTKSRFSVSRTNEMTSPPLPQPKQ